ncbi:MAG: Uncharacterised protein [Flavobacteriaceae bacterium]|jgi:hypothetical protein|nr:MAG: Uncharacterised protein [Flavobacteriaceae bacterium]
MRYLLILVLIVAPFCWSQQSTDPLILQADTLDLGQRPILLNEVIVGANNLTAYELVLAAKKVMESSAQHKDQELTYFLRHSELNEVDLNLDLKESTIEQISNDFIHQITQSIPKQSSLHTEALYRLIQQDSLGKSARLLHGFQLEEESSKIDAENVAEFFLEKIEESLSKGNYFKVKSGIFGGKIEEDDIVLDDLRPTKDSLVGDSIDIAKSHQVASAAGYQRLNEFNRYQPYDSDPVVGVFEKPKRFDFQIIDYKYYKEQWVHVIAFKEKSKAQFYGELWINEKDNALIQFKFINTRPIKSIKLLGFEYSEPRAQGQFLYKKFDDGIYRHYFGRLELDTKVNVNRPLSFIEKKKAFIGGRKVNRVDIDISFGLNQIEEYTYILSKNSTLEIDTKSLSVLEKLDSYPSHYWKNEAFSIAPSEAMKNFKKAIEK